MEIKHYIMVKKNQNILMVECSEQESILEAMIRQGVTYHSDCGGRGTCGKCKVKLMEGELEMSTSDYKVLSEDELKSGLRLACKAYPRDNITIALNTFEEAAMKVLTESSGELPSNPSSLGYGSGYYIGIDLGTTTLAYRLVEGRTGEVVATHSGVNPQRVYGADVISRMKASVDGNGDKLRDIIRDSLRTGILQLIREAEIEASMVRHIAIAGNTTMVHLLMGYPCETLGSYPFTPVNSNRIDLTYQELFEADHSRVQQSGTLSSGEITASEKLRTLPISVLPGISTFVGGDIVAGLGICGFDLADEICLLIDLGTNGELALGNKDKILVTSTAAGPAFEGGNISCGLGSVPGAISQVTIEDDVVHLKTIADKAPLGICGTGVVELCAELLRTGAMDETGLLREEFFHKGYALSQEDQLRVIFTQKDIRELQLAKAAISAGIELVMRRYGISYHQLSKVYLAGGFGFVLDIDKAIAIGLLPGELKNKVFTIGNSSLAGAVRFSMDTNFAERLDYIIGSAEEVHLSNEAEFQNLYLEQINFPARAEL
ncbi:MAG: hypothetical protein K0R46_1693 [Herbinix sp.]|nr:hypothetical protein [Herbinix sp.]